MNLVVNISNEKLCSRTDEEREGEETKRQNNYPSLGDAVQKHQSSKKKKSRKWLITEILYVFRIYCIFITYRTMWGNLCHRHLQLAHPEVCWIGWHTSAQEIKWATVEPLVTTGKGRSSVWAVSVSVHGDSSVSNDRKWWACGHFLLHLWPLSYFTNGQLVAREPHLLPAPLQEKSTF